jgi:threonine dehydrogenase-like Zn-dependent dehydrogenase
MPIGVGRDGAAAELVAAPARFAYKVSEDLGGPLAALIEPLACCLHALESSQGVKDRDVLVLGGGTMGLLIGIAAEAAGAGRVTIADPSPAKLAIARQAGIARTTTPAELGDEAYEVVFEAAGVRAALEQAFRLVEKTGVLVQVGVHDADATVPIVPFKVYERELRIIGSNSLANKFPRAVDVMMDIRDRAAALIGPSYPVFDFAEAVEAMSRGDTVKTQLRFD